MNGISALICEFNPLHSGHMHILNKLGEAGDIRVCIMSGNFVQRGESAVLDKYERAKAAIDCGADLVLELPFPWSASPAELFSLGAMTIAHAVGATRIVFGSECGDTELLRTASHLSESEEFVSAVKEEYRGNTGYAKARMSAAKRIMPETAEIFASSNDMLALEYLKSAEKCGFAPDFEAVLRVEGDGYMSAEKIREKISEGALCVPCKTCPDFDTLKSHAVGLHRLYDIEHILFSLGKNRVDSFDFKSGIVSRLSSAASESADGGEMIKLAATKKYTNARIKRASLMSVLSVGDDIVRQSPLFTVLLGANKAGCALVPSLKDRITVVTKPSQTDALNSATRAQYEIQKRADELYSLCKGVPRPYFLKCKPYIVE